MAREEGRRVSGGGVRRYGDMRGGSEGDVGEGEVIVSFARAGGSI